MAGAVVGKVPIDCGRLEVGDRAHGRWSDLRTDQWLAVGGRVNLKVLDAVSTVWEPRE